MGEATTPSGFLHVHMRQMKEKHDAVYESRPQASWPRSCFSGPYRISCFVPQTDRNGGD
uniref:Uncharacterized protein n=1 Tax=Colletotrichum scovillei TaxID=1209932 RepID=A0A9P7R1B4_9PEZI